MKVYVENAVVERVFETPYGHGARVREEREHQGQTYKQYATLWLKDRPEFEAGWLVNASGYLRVKSKVLDNGKAASDIELQGARVQSAQPGAAPSSEPPADDPWTSGGDPSWS